MAQDGAGPRQIGSATFENFSLPERERLANGSLAVLATLQQKFDEINHGLVLCNGINMYPNAFNPGTPMLPDYNFGIVDECDGVETEHLAAFESRDHATGRLNITRVRKNLELIEQAAAMNKTVMINMWAGPVVRPDGWGPAGTTPNTTSEWRAALEQHFNFSAALFLVVAAPTVFFEYLIRHTFISIGNHKRIRPFLKRMLIIEKDNSVLRYLLCCAPGMLNGTLCPAAW